jgi:hypothetical protein
MTLSAKVALPIALIIAVVCVTTGWIIDAHYGLNIWDEGYLWYGVQRVRLGEVPIRDFMAYDPGRYYWTAGVMSLWGGKGIMDVRAAVAVFQCLGLAAGIWVLASASGMRRPGLLTPAALILLLWMFPRHKLFDIALSILFVAAFLWWFRRPTVRRHFLVGLIIGIAACFGRNHGVYALVGSGLGFGWLALKERHLPEWRPILAWVAGVAAGFVPILVACLFVPGFFEAFHKSILFLFELKATNLPLPVPWPWTIPYSSLSTGMAIRQGLVGLGFVGVLFYPIFGIACLVLRRVRDHSMDPAWAATVCLAVPYAHYAFSRADIGHLAQGIFPALLGCILWLSSLPAVWSWLGSSVLFVATLWTTLTSHPRTDCIGEGAACTAVEVSGQTLLLPPAVTDDVTLLRELAMKYAPAGRSFVATPYWPGAYALLERRSPLWEIYGTTARSASFQETEIERMRQAHPGFVLVFDFPLDNRDELRYSHTHPVMDRYIRDHFVPLPSPNPNYRIYRAEDPVERPD